MDASRHDARGPAAALTDDLPARGDPIVVQELVLSHARRQRAAVGLHLVGPPLVAAVVWSEVPHTPLMVWAGAVMLFGLFRLAVYLHARFGRVSAWLAAVDRARGATVTAAAGGLLWVVGAVLVILTTDRLADHAFIAGLVAIFGAGATVTLSSYLSAFYAGILPMLGAAAAALMSVGETTQLAMGGALLLFALPLSASARLGHKSVVRSAQLKSQNENLVRRLAAERDAADARVVSQTAELQLANMELERRIRELTTVQRVYGDREMQLRMIADHLPVLVRFVDRGLTIRYVNRHCSTLYGVDAASLIGRPAWEMEGEDAFARTRSHLDQVFAGESVIFNEMHQGPNGWREMHVQVVPHFATDGSVFGFVDVRQDRTEERAHERALTESEERLRSVIQNMPVMMSAMDSAGNVIVWNRECERVTGYSAEEIVGKENGLALLYRDPAYREQVKRAMLVHSDYRDWEWDLNCRDGTVKTVSWFNISSHFPVPGWASWEMGFDVSDRRRTQLKLEEALAHERELGELKSRFVAMASHEFRTPLTTIQAAVDLLLRYGDRLAEEQKTRNLDEIRREVGTINDLLDAVLTIGQAEAGKLRFHPRPTDLRSLCADLLEKAKLDALPSHAFSFDCQGACTSATVDPQLVRHIITNLLSNAVKYSPDGGAIALMLRCDPDGVVLEVADRGIGVPEAGREHLFEAFHRFDNVGTISGTGLGLAIVARAVEQHGGTVDFESEPGVGTTVRVRLPTAAPAEA